VLGGLAIAGQVTVTIGPTIGGLLVGSLGGQAAFLVNVPVTIAALAMALFWLPPDPPRPRRHSARETIFRIDLPGIARFGAAMTGGCGGVRRSALLLGVACPSSLPRSAAAGSESRVDPRLPAVGTPASSERT
jgi:MFS family permease